MPEKSLFLSILVVNKHDARDKRNIPIKYTYVRKRENNSKFIPKRSGIEI